MRLFKRLQQRIDDSPLLWWWSFIVMMVPPVALMFTEAPPVLARIGGALLAGAFYAIWLSAWKNLSKAVLWLLPFMIFNGWEIVLLGLYGRNVIAVDMFLNFVTTNPDEVGELLGNLWISVGLVILLYLPVLVCSIWLLLKHKKAIVVRSFPWAVSAFVIGLALTVPFVVKGSYRYERDLFPVNVCYNLGKAFVEHSRSSNSMETAAKFVFGTTSTRPDSLPETYILVVGENSRGDRWQLNGYNRPTNPQLSGTDGLISFNKALSQSNTTHKSVPLLLTHLTSVNYGDSIDKVKGILTAFAEAGYSTTFISNQRRNHSYIDRLGEEAKHSVFIRDKYPEGLPEGDLALLKYVKEALATDSAVKRLIVLHTYGSHFSYRDRYEEGPFKPDTYPAASQNYKAQLNNAYDNTILVTDSLLSSLIDIVNHQPGITAMLYTSDHGEDIFDDSRNLFLHASPSPSFYQVRVPFIVWTSPSYRAEHPEIYRRIVENQHKMLSSSAAFFPLALDIAGLSTLYRPSGYSPATDMRPNTAPTYLTDLNESVPLQKSGFQKPDITLLQQLSQTGGR